MLRISQLIGATVICFILLEFSAKLSLSSYLAFKTKNNFSPLKYTDDIIKTLYQTEDPQSYRETLLQTWTNFGRYEPFVDHGESPVNKKYLNISPQGFRVIKNQVAWFDPKKANIFFFGGSTTFGFGVKDEETIPSYFQEELKKKHLEIRDQIAVYNFGAGAYYSTLERIRFEQLLSQNIVPHTAVFIDGLNEVQQSLEDQAPNSDFIRYRTQLTTWELFVHDLSIMAFMKRLVSKFASGTNITPAPDDSILKRAVTRITQNHKMIEALGRAYKVRIIFVKQPNPYFHYDSSKSAVPKHDPPWPQFPEQVKKFYERWKPTYQTLLLQDVKIPGQMYVDEVHYSPSMSQAIAGQISEISRF